MSLNSCPNLSSSISLPHLKLLKQYEDENADVGLWNSSLSLFLDKVIPLSSHKNNDGMGMKFCSLCPLLPFFIFLFAPVLLTFSKDLWRWASSMCFKCAAHSPLSLHTLAQAENSCAYFIHSHSMKLKPILFPKRTWWKCLD